MSSLAMDLAVLRNLLLLLLLLLIVLNLRVVTESIFTETEPRFSFFDMQL